MLRTVLEDRRSFYDGAQLEGLSFMMGLIENGGSGKKWNERTDEFDFEHKGAVEKIPSVGPRPADGRVRFLAPLGVLGPDP
jgi:hypothetical protein